jgi:hypothetical protein
MRFDPDAHLNQLRGDLSTSPSQPKCRESRNCRNEYTRTSNEGVNAEQTKVPNTTPNGGDELSQTNISVAAIAAFAAKPPPPPSTIIPRKIQDALAVLERACPEHIPTDVWRQAVADGRRFMDEWRLVAEETGWTADELFGLHDPPAKPHPSYDRLARYDCRGLIWGLSGNPVIQLNASEASIRYPSGSVTVYRKLNKPALGPLGDSLDDFV